MTTIDNSAARLPLPRPRPWGTAAAAALLLAAGAAAYSNSLGGPFIFDDLPLVPDNPDLRGDRSPWGVAISPSFRTRPVIALTVALNYALGGLDVRGYHALNLVIHLLAALALFGVVRRTLRLAAPVLADKGGMPTSKTRLGEPPLRGHAGGESKNMPSERRAGHATLDSGASTGLALAVALLWMLHPLQTQSVTYIIQRCESLMGLFYLLTLYAAIRGATSRRPWAWYAAAVLACFLGMGSKQVMLTAPLVVLLYDRTFLAGSFREALRRRWGLYAALAGTWVLIIPYVVVTQLWLFLVTAHPAGPSHPLPTPIVYLATQFGVVLHYLRLAAWPDALCLDYGRPAAPTVATVLPPALLVLGMLGLTAWALVRRPAAGFVGAAFFIILAPTSSVVPSMDIEFEHRMYLPLAALAALAVIGMYIGWTRIASRWAAPRLRQAVPLAAVALIAVALGARTHARNDDYRTARCIYEDTIRKCPANARAHANLGACLTAGRAASEAPEAWDEAIGHYREALRLNPDYADAHYNLAIALANRGQASDAIAHYEEALRVKPKYPEAHYNLANALARRGQVDEAIQHYLEALRLSPDDAQAHNNLAVALGSKGRTDEAIRHLRETLRIKPDFAEPHFFLAWFLATDPDEKRRNGAEAVRLAERGCLLATRKEPAFLDALAAAYAEAGRFQEAVAAAKQAEALAWSLGRRDDADQFRMRLRLYEAGRPYRAERAP